MMKMSDVEFRQEVLQFNLSFTLWVSTTLCHDLWNIFQRSDTCKLIWVMTDADFFFINILFKHASLGKKKNNATDSMTVVKPIQAMFMESSRFQVSY